MRSRSTFIPLLCLALGAAGCSCSDDPGVGPGPVDGATTTGMDGAVATDGSMGWPDGTILADGPIELIDGGTVIEEDGGGTWVCYQVTCAGHLTECGDCMDNDSDGLVDSRDGECLGPCDNTEGPALTTGVGGETGGPCKADCYFDWGNGPGGDGCSWDSRCDPLSVAPDYNPEGEGCAFVAPADRRGNINCPATQSAMCLDICPPLTPNGCDCFGCCTFDELRGRAMADGGEFVWLGSVFPDTNNGSCTLADIDETSLCRPCTPVADCFNDCGHCELCVGRDTLPPECTPTIYPDGGVSYPDGATSYPDAALPDGGTYGPRCPAGIQACGLAADDPCPSGYWCITGCCQSTFI